MIKVGITGNMGSGKSLVCGLLEYLGVPVFYADTEAKRLMHTDQQLQEEVIALLGPGAFPDGQMDRRYIASKVFRSERSLNRLNALVHPRVQEAGLTWFRSLPPSIPYAVEEAALLYESGGYQLLDHIILVSAPLEIRIQRVIERDQTTREEVLSRMHRQWPEEKKIALADDVIYNDSSILLLPQVLQIHAKLSVSI
jgi:dephospho-CoA kinase